MTGVWGLVNAAIAYAGWLGPEPEPSGLGRLLWINAGLDLVYVLVGLVLWKRESPILRGFGLVLQGLFLLAFDLYHALQI